MVSKKLLLGAAAVLTLAAAPAFAQTVGSSVTGANGNGSDTNVHNRTSITNRSEVNQRSSTETNTRTTNLSFADNSQRNGNVRLVADQDLDQSITNHDPLNFSGNGSTYASGSNSVNGAAFAAYSGILNQGWNTGTNANTAAATNIAANGSTSFTTH